MECKELMKIRKMRSTEKLVKNLAAETITKGLRRYHTIVSAHTRESPSSNVGFTFILPQFESK